MSQCSRPIPVGILVSVSGPPRKRRTSIDKLPSIRKEVNLPLRVGIGVGVAFTVLVALTSLLAYGFSRRAPEPVAQWQTGIQRAIDKAPLEAVAPPIAVAQIDPPAASASPSAPAAQSSVPAMPREVQTTPAARQLANPVLQAVSAAPVCSNYGTAITFFENPPDAFRQAAKENKLVLMVHLSGNFEDPALT